MTPVPPPAFSHLADLSTPAARRRYATACRSSAIVLDREGQPTAAAGLRARAAQLEHVDDAGVDTPNGDSA